MLSLQLWCHTGASGSTHLRPELPPRTCSPPRRSSLSVSREAPLARAPGLSHLQLSRSNHSLKSPSLETRELDPVAALAPLPLSIPTAVSGSITSFSNSSQQCFSPSFSTNHSGVDSHAGHGPQPSPHVSRTFPDHLPFVFWTNCTDKMLP